MEAPGLLTAQEIADLVRVPLSEAYRLGREGNLRPAVVRVGNRMRFRREYVDRAEGRAPSVVGTPYWD